MKSLLLVAALLLSNNVFAGCAIANDKNSYGTACSTLSKKDAEDKAAVECQKSGGKDCMTLAHFESGCWAIAKDRTLGISAYAFGKATVEEAKAESITSCLSQGGKNCVNTLNVGCESYITNPNEGGQNKSKTFDIMKWMQLNLEDEKKMSQAIPNWRDILNDNKFRSWKAMQLTPINDLFYSKDASKLIKLMNIYLGKEIPDVIPTSVAQQSQSYTSTPQLKKSDLNADAQQLLKDKQDAMAMMRMNSNITESQPNEEYSFPQGNTQPAQVQSSRVDCRSLDGFWNRFQCAQKETAREQQEDKLDKLRVQCDGFGLQRGTNEYAQCMMKLQEQDNANKKAEQERLDRLLHPSAPVINSTTCRGTVNGNEIRTTCD